MSMSAAERVDEAPRVAGRLVALALSTAVVFFALGVALKPIFPDGLPPGPEGRRIYLSLLVVALVVAQVVIVALAEKGEWMRTGLGHAGWSPVAILGGLGIGAAIPAGAALIGQLSGAPNLALAWVWPTTGVLMIALVGSLLDALLLRGYVIGLLADAWGDVAAVALTAFVATLLALQVESPTPVQTVDAFLLAVCLGVLRLRTGSLVAAWLAQLAWAVVRDGFGTIPIPGVTAGLLALISFLLFRLRSRTAGPQRA